MTNTDSASVSVIDAANDMVIKNITVGNDPFHLISMLPPQLVKKYMSANIDFSNTGQRFYFSNIY